MHWRIGVAQDPHEAEMLSMPLNAIRYDDVSVVLLLDDLAWRWGGKIQFSPQALRGATGTIVSPLRRLGEPPPVRAFQ